MTASLLKSPGLFSSNAVVWIVSIRPPISKSSRPFNNPLVIVPKAPITIGTIVTFMFHSFLRVFSTSFSRWFHTSLSDTRCPQISRTLSSILTDLNNAVVWMVSTGPIVSKSFSPCANTMVTVLDLIITNSITVTFMFHSFSQFSSKVEVLFIYFSFTM